MNNSGGHVTDDNVIYANFGTRKRVTTADEVNRVSRRDRGGTVLNAAATRIWRIIERATDAGRITRGRQYARAGHVVGLDVRVGAVHGRVAGSQNEPFSVLLQLPYRDKDELGEVSAALARSPGSMSRAREGNLSDTVLDILYAPTGEDMRFSCTCPDGERVCKHVVAVADRLAARVDADPSVIFALRGLDFSQLEELVMAEAHKASQDAFNPYSLDSQEERNELFWSGRSLPELPRPKVAPALDDSDMDLLRKAMRAVSHTNIDLLRAVSDIEDLYHELTR